MVAIWYISFGFGTYVSIREEERGVLRKKIKERIKRQRKNVYELDNWKFK